MSRKTDSARITNDQLEAILTIGLIVVLCVIGLVLVLTGHEAGYWFFLPAFVLLMGVI